MTADSSPGALLARERQAALGSQLAQVDAAIGRLDAGHYGQCERCGQPIPAARLTARPTATTCIRCASR
jgi:RNA polymerase-binding protein DksA